MNRTAMILMLVGCKHTWGLPNAELNNNKTKCPPFTRNFFLILVFYLILFNEKSANLDFCRNIYSLRSWQEESENTE